MLMEETSVTLIDMLEIFLDDDIIISMKRDDEILHTFEVPFPSAGYGGGMLMLSPSERYLVFSYYSGQSEEAYILFEIQDSCLEFIYGSELNADISGYIDLISQGLLPCRSLCCVNVSTEQIPHSSAAGKFIPKYKVK